jgi:hypothetical protein
MPLRTFARRALALAVVVGLPAAAPGGALASPAPVAELQGILRGTTIVLDPYFRWKPTEAASGILGVAEGTTREFETIEVTIGADRSVFTAAQRVAFEADRVRRSEERGEPLNAEKDMPLAANLSIVRYKAKDRVYACAAKQIGRTALYARGTATVKYEAALAKLVTSILANVRSTTDEIDGWVPPEVKTAWVREPAADLVVVHDGVVRPVVKDEVAKVVREAHGVVRRAISGSWAAPFPPVLRVVRERDLYVHLTGRRDAKDADAVYVPSRGEMFVVAKGDVPPDAPVVKAAVEQALHHALGGANAQPISTGLARYALAVRGGAAPGALLPEGEAQALARAKSKEALTWGRILKLPSVVNFLGRDAETRVLDAEMAVDYLLHSGGAQAKPSLDKWATGFRKFGHPDAAAEAALRDMNVEASDAEYWKYWTDRTTPKKPAGKGK